MLPFERKLRFVLNMLPVASDAYSKIIASWLRARWGSMQHFDDFCLKVLLFGFEYLRSNNISGNSPFDKYNQPIASCYAVSVGAERINTQLNRFAGFHNVLTSSKDFSAGCSEN